MVGRKYQRDHMLIAQDWNNEALETVDRSSQPFVKYAGKSTFSPPFHAFSLLQHGDTRALLWALENSTDPDSEQSCLRAGILEILRAEQG